MPKPILVLLASTAIAFAAPEPVSPRYEAIAPGLDYAHITVSNKPWSIHVARMSRADKCLGLVTTLAKDHIEGLSTVAEQAKALDGRLEEPLVAVNGDFFVIKPGPYQGDPLGLEIVNGELVSGPGQATFWLSRRKPHIEPIGARFEVWWPDGARSAMGLNGNPAAKSAMLFTPAFGVSTRATNAFELELLPVKKHAWLPLRPDEHYRARVKAIHAEGNTQLMPGEMVLTITNSGTNHIAGLAPGKVIEFATTLCPKVGHPDIAIGGGPLLLQAGKLMVSTSSKPVKKNSLAPRHPRTAVGYNKKYCFLAEVDGRQPELSIGMNLVELAELMQELGCTDAMNLDGGGSSTFWMQGRIMNSPSDKHERAVANALVVVRRKK